MRRKGELDNLILRPTLHRPFHICFTSHRRSQDEEGRRRHKERERERGECITQNGQVQYRGERERERRRRGKRLKVLFPAKQRDEGGQITK